MHGVVVHPAISWSESELWWKLARHEHSDYRCSFASPSSGLAASLAPDVRPHGSSWFKLCVALALPSKLRKPPTTRSCSCCFARLHRSWSRPRSVGHSGLDWTHVEPAGLGRAGFWGAWTSQLEKHSASRGEFQISGHYIVVACPERMEPVGPPLASAQSNQNPGVCV